MYLGPLSKLTKLICKSNQHLIQFGTPWIHLTLTLKNIAVCNQYCRNGDVRFPLAFSLYLLSLKYTQITVKPERSVEVYYFAQ